MEKMVIGSESVLIEVAHQVLQKLNARARTEAATVLALSGDLGAGKTTFVQMLGTLLRVREDITSPTFVIMKIYQLDAQRDSPFTELIHIDAYRIEVLDEMRVIGFSELLQKGNTLICIEWAEKIKELLPADTLCMHIAIEGESRVVTLS
jgi:tRNA threonylcarbamoyladenosine biosynthesis protein TsaE